MSKPLTVGSLFAGIGGLELGLERAGMKVKWQVEIDDYATKVLEKHWPHVARWRDITTFPPDAESEQGRDKPEDLANGQGWNSGAVIGSGGSEWRVDLICGGFPCQDISYAGKGAGLDGERSGLFYEAIRVVGLIKPRFVLLENVAALLNRGLSDVLGTLASIGYSAEWHCLQAADVGAPHIRDRVFVIAYSDTESPSENKQQTNNQRVSPQPRRIRDDLANTSGPRLEERKGPPKEWPYPTATRSNWWSTEPDLGRVANGVPKRVDRLRCLGNAVVPQVAEVFGRYIVEFNERA